MIALAILETLRADMPGVMEGSQTTDPAQQRGGAVLTLPSAKVWPSVFVSFWSWQPGDITQDPVHSESMLCRWSVYTPVPLVVPKGP